MIAIGRNRIALVIEPGQHEWHGDFQKFRWLYPYPYFPPDLFIGGARKQRLIVRPKGTQHREANTANARDKILILGTEVVPLSVGGAVATPR